MTITKQDWEKTFSRYYRHLIGCLVTGAGVTEDGFPFLLVAPRGGSGDKAYRVEISQDPEGNAAGFLLLPDMSGGNR